MLYALTVCYGFFGAIIISDLFLILNGLSLVGISYTGQYRIVWVMALFLSDTILAISYDIEDTSSKIGLLIFTYFSYRQLWISVAVKAAYLENVKIDKHVW